jgi:hypothetical protein
MDAMPERNAFASKQESAKMATSFPMEIEALDVPFAVVPNAAFPDATPVCVLTNNGAAPAFDTFIKSYFPGPQPPAGSKEGADPWQIEFRWQTKGPGIAGAWVLDAWLENLTAGPNVHVPGFPHIVPGAGPAYDEILPIAPDAVAPPGFPAADTARLFRLVTTIRCADASGPAHIRVVGRGVGPIIEFYRPLV